MLAVLTVEPYAVGRISGIFEHFYEEIAESWACQFKYRYANLNDDGTLNIPLHLRDVFMDFERLYENLRYQRLEHIKPRRRSISGAVDEHGRPIYDVISRPVFMIANNATTARKCCPMEKTWEQQQQQGKDRETTRKRSKSVDLGHLRELANLLEQVGIDAAEAENESIDV